MRADIHDGRERMLQSEAGYIDARPHQPGSTKTSCNARPDHTLGSDHDLALWALMSASTSYGLCFSWRDENNAARGTHLSPRENKPYIRVKYTRSSIGMKLYDERCSLCAANDARLDFPTSSISPKA